MDRYIRVQGLPPGAVHTSSRQLTIPGGGGGRGVIEHATDDLLSSATAAHQGPSKENWVQGLPQGAVHTSSRQLTEPSGSSRGHPDRWLSQRAVHTRIFNLIQVLD